MLAFVATQRWRSAHRLLEGLRASALQAPDLRAQVYDSALPVCEAFVAFGKGRYTRAAQQLQEQQRLVRGCGGSRAQCDLLHLTWLEAALRSRQPALAQRLLGERMATRPQSPYNEQLRDRMAQTLSGARSRAVEAAPQVGPPGGLRSGAPVARLRGAEGRYTTATQPRSADARRIPALARLPAMP